jgi:hypothetical protein
MAAVVAAPASPVLAVVSGWTSSVDGPAVTGVPCVPLIAGQGMRS